MDTATLEADYQRCLEKVGKFKQQFEISHQAHFHKITSTILTVMSGYLRPKSKEHIGRYLFERRGLRKYINALKDYPEFREAEITRSDGYFSDVSDVLEGMRVDAHLSGPAKYGHYAEMVLEQKNR